MGQVYLSADSRTRIQDLIKDKKITQARLAEMSGVSESIISRYLQGKTKNLGDGNIIKLAKTLQVSTDFLLGETNIPDRKILISMNSCFPQRRQSFFTLVKWM